jgi:fatty acyl-CoA reductase
MRKWDFKSDNFKAIYRDLPAAEKMIFNMNTEEVDILPYLKDVILGGREYCLKEPPSSLPKARIALKM